MCRIKFWTYIQVGTLLLYQLTRCVSIYFVLLAPSPNTVNRLSVESRKSAASSPSVEQRQRSSSITSHPSSPASFHSNHSQQSTSGNKGKPYLTSAD